MHAPRSQPHVAQPQRVGDHRDRGKAHRRAGEHRAQEQPEQRIEHAGGDRDAQRVVDEGEEAGSGGCCASSPGSAGGRGRCPADRRGPASRPALSMATSVPVPMAMPTWASARAGASLIPSPAMATIRPCAFSRRTTSTLSSGSTSASTWSMPSLARHGLGRRPVVAGEHHDVESLRREVARWPRAVRGLDRVGHAQQARRLSSTSTKITVWPSRQSRSACSSRSVGMIVSLAMRAVADRHGAAVDLARHALARDRLELLRTSAEVELPRSARPRPRRAASGCSLARSRLAASRSSSASLSSPVAHHRDQARLALGERAGLVDHQRVDLLQQLRAPRRSSISTPACAPRPMPTMIDIGVARPSAQGQAMISTATALTSA